MEVKKKSCRDWAEEHKVELIIAGIGVGVTIAVILGIKKVASKEDVLEEVAKNFIEKMPEEICSIETPIIPETVKDIVKRVPHEVRMHLRKLPEGHKPSIEKLAVADELGISLLPGQTLVEAYRTGEVAA